ncbi:MAG TPA: sterol desaturase family protein [Turneriella sp.]|nr:sterol desaturase family protein [Turneriella sp.]
MPIPAHYANLIALAVPIFFISIAIEFFVSLAMKRRIYRINDSIADLSAGMLQELVGVFTKSIRFGLYILIFEAVHKPTAATNAAYGLPINAATWIALFILVDVAYYWFHRHAHTFAVMWGSHEAHHSSQEYNFAVALRQGAFQGLFSFPYYLPLAIVGFTPIQFLVCTQLNTLYQFFIHTRLVGKLGFLEYFMNTPSHHRVHHGVNPKYIDKNHAGVFIVWDKLFGTFQVEEEEPCYGTVKPLNTFNPIWTQLHYFWHLIKMTYHARGMDKLKVWIKGPGWKPDYLGKIEPVPEVDAATYQKYDAPNALTLKVYATVVFLLSLMPFLILQRNTQLPLANQLLLASLLLLGLATAGGLMMRQRWSFVLEIIRIFVFAAAALGIVSVLTQKNFYTASILIISVSAVQLLLLFFTLRYSGRKTQIA